MDKDWLRERAYPFIKGPAEFYRHFPNFKKEADGKYHIHHLNNGESSWNSSDTPNEVSAMHTIFPLAIRASETWDGRRPRPAARTETRNAERVGAAAALTGIVYGSKVRLSRLVSAELKRRFLGTGWAASCSMALAAPDFRNRLRLREGWAR
jgi:hypothetical protein